MARTPCFSARVNTETPSGLVNGINLTYTVTKNIKKVIEFAINGQVIHPSEYSFSGNIITFIAAPALDLAGTSFTIIYV
jgi:hypothetical protein